MSESWGVAASSYHQGAINFAEFAERTQRERQWWVRQLRTKLTPIPVWHGEEDSQQDFLLDLFVRAKRFDPERASAGGFFRHGIKRVGKNIQKARGVEQHRRTGKPMFERTFSTVGLSGPPETPDPSREKDIEGSLLRTQYYEVLRLLCRTKKQLAVVCALQACGGSLAGATAHLYADLDLRRDLRLGSERQATLAIERVVRQLIAAYGKKEAQA